MVKRRDLANAVRMLSVDAVQKANSGHPGMPMGMADIAEVLWNSFLKHNPADPSWPNRDRFILSNGHGCMLHYALLHLSGYDLSIEDLRQFRQLHSKTPGHPEFGDTVGVETTTGPLGQGLANAVGMAIAEKNMAATFNRPGFNLVDHHTYVFLGDGCLMEGISHEVCSLAGTYGLNKLIAIYDDNQISIDGEVSGWFTDNTPQRFEAYGWHVIPTVDGHDAEAVYAAIDAAKKITDKPVLICCQTTIGFGSPHLAGTADTHGSPLGDAEIKAVREALHWPYAPFEIPDDYYAAWNARSKGAKLEQEWEALYNAYEKTHPELAAEWSRRTKGILPENWNAHVNAVVDAFQAKKETMATRKASQASINAYSPLLPEFIGGSADLTGSNLTNWTGMQVFTANHPAGRYLHYGVREFGMSAIMNGLALYRGLIPFGGTFLTFSDYARNAVRLAALMRQRVIFVYTHDSIGLGEDGPTHQPVEQGPSLRMIPHLSVWRPCDTAETAVAWGYAIEYHGPTCLLLSRQNVVHQARDEATVRLIKRGGYILKDCQGEPNLILIATGSEVQLIVEAAEKLSSNDINVRVVSMPSVDVFLAQSDAYREQVLPRAITARIAVEAAVTTGWYQFVGLEGKVIGLDRFGASAPASAVYKECGITVDHIIAAAHEVISQQKDCNVISNA